MSHERVLREPVSMLPVVCRVPEGSYKRVGLCSPEDRALRLGCSHTIARIKLAAAINELDLVAEKVSGSRSHLAEELNWLNNEIHLLDHRKGAAESALAGAVAEVYGADERVPNCGRLRKAEEEVREMERLHDEYVDRIGRLKDKVARELDRMIGKVACTTLNRNADE